MSGWTTRTSCAICRVDRTLSVTSGEAEVDILFRCFYVPLGVIKGHPVLSLRWPLTPMPSPRRSGIMGALTSNLGSTDTAVGDGGLSIVVDPVVIQLGRQGAFQEGLRKV
jgi:hypothetical protein